MNDNIYFISMEGKSGFQIGSFIVDEEIPLPVLIEEGEKFTPEHINPQNVINGMIALIRDDLNNEHLAYYRKFIFEVQPDIEGRLAAAAYEAESHHDFIDAIQLFRTLQALKPESFDHQLNLAICYDEFSQDLYHQGKIAEAEKMEELSYEYYQIIEGWAEKSEQALFYLGRFYMIRENYDKALDYFQEFLQNSTNMDRKKEVKAIIREIKELGMLDDDYKMAYQLIEADQEDKAFEYIDNYLKKFPESWNGYYIKGIALRKQEKFEQAIPFFEKALEQNQDSQDICNELGICYMNTKRYLQAEKYFFHSLRINSEDIAVYHNLALLCYHQDKIDDAIKYCNLILEQYPKDLEAKELLKMFDQKFPKKK
ncbi:MAG: tetratricopeptide repeat protein [Spirochaetes bacterium]|nr:tetratricopeptide repeat protein [Spirochaetota bacterium]